MIPVLDIDNLPFRISFEGGNCAIFKWDDSKCFVVSEGNVSRINGVELWEIPIVAIQNSGALII